MIGKIRLESSGLPDRNTKDPTLEMGNMTEEERANVEARAKMEAAAIAEMATDDMSLYHLRQVMKQRDEALERLRTSDNMLASVRGNLDAIHKYAHSDAISLYLKPTLGMNVCTWIVELCKRLTKERDEDRARLKSYRALIERSVEFWRGKLLQPIGSENSQVQNVLMMEMIEALNPSTQTVTIAEVNTETTTPCTLEVERYCLVWEQHRGALVTLDSCRRGGKWAGPDWWAIRRGEMVMNHTCALWQAEPIPSDRTERFYAECRFNSLEEAIAWWDKQPQPIRGVRNPFRTEDENLRNFNEKNTLGVDKPQSEG